jgi:hypothetical protein
MKPLTITFESKIPTLNEYIDVERTNKYGAASMKKSATTNCMDESLNHRGLIDPNGLYDVVAHWETKDNRLDPDNVYFGIKFVLDGMVKAGIINNDGRKNIRNINNEIETTGENKLILTLIKAI